jgi:hypothetical protein
VLGLKPYRTGPLAPSPLLHSPTSALHRHMGPTGQSLALARTRISVSLLVGLLRQSAPWRCTPSKVTCGWDPPVGVSPFLASCGCNRTRAQFVALAPPTSQTPYNIEGKPPPLSSQPPATSSHSLVLSNFAVQTPAWKVKPPHTGCVFFGGEPSVSVREAVRVHLQRVWGCAGRDLRAVAGDFASMRILHLATATTRRGSSTLPNTW